MEIARLSPDEVLKLVEAAIQAPSADNMQPWRFRVGEDSLELRLDPGLTGLFFDPAAVASEMGCGALIENVEQVACQLGYSAQVRFFSGADDGVVARVTFSAATGNRNGTLSDEVFTRCTDRGLYRKRHTLTDAEKASLSDSMHDFSGHNLAFHDQPEARRQFIHAVYQADTIRFSHPETHRDFHHVLRFGADAERSRDGLAQSTLGIEFFFIPVLKLLKPWPLTRLLNRIGLHHLMALRGVWLPMVTAPSLVSIVHSGPRDNFQSGRAMQRFWLEATRLGLSVQPLGAFPLFLARLQVLDGQGFSDREVAKLQRLRKGMAQFLPVLGETESQLVMLFRVGHAKKQAGRSLRRPAETFID